MQCKRNLKTTIKSYRKSKANVDLILKVAYVYVSLAYDHAYRFIDNPLITVCEPLLPSLVTLNVNRDDSHRKTMRNPYLITINRVRCQVGTSIRLPVGQVNISEIALEGERGQCFFVGPRQRERVWVPWLHRPGKSRAVSLDVSLDETITVNKTGYTLYVSLYVGVLRFHQLHSAMFNRNCRKTMMKQQVTLHCCRMFALKKF